MPEQKMKTLTCEGPPKHEYERPSGRGRPPRYCDEHRPAKPEPKQKPERQTQVEAESDERVNPFIAKAEKEKNRAKTAPARAGKEEKRRIEEMRAEETLEREFEGIDEREREAYARYDEAFKIANGQPIGKGRDTDDPKLWNRVHQAQSTAINVSSRKRWLFDHFEKLTNGDKPDEVDQIWEGHPTKADADAIIADAHVPTGVYIDDSQPGQVGTTGQPTGQQLQTAPYGDMDETDAEILAMFESLADEDA